MKEAKEIAIIRLLRLQGIDRIFARARQDLAASMKQLNVPEKDTGIIMEILDSMTTPESLDEFKHLFLPAYDEQFDKEELEHLIEILSDPVYQKLVETQPMVSNQVLRSMLDWVGDKMQPILERLKNEADINPDDPDDPNPWKDDVSLFGDDDDLIGG